MNPQHTDMILDILFDCGNTITECISFEINFPQKSHPAIKSDIAAVEQLLSDQYIRALRLVSDTQQSCREVQRRYDTSREKLKDRAKVIGQSYPSRLELMGQSPLLTK